MEKRHQLSESTFGLPKPLRKFQQDIPKLLRIYSSVGIKHIHKSLRQRFFVSRRVRAGSLSALGSLTRHFDQSPRLFWRTFQPLTLIQKTLLTQTCTLANSMLSFYLFFLILSLYIFIILLFTSSLIQKWQSENHILKAL